MSRRMSRAARSVWVFSLYLFALGGVLMIVPNWFLYQFRLPATNEVWIRIVGLLVAILGYYYCRAGLAESTDFILGTVYGRCAVLVGLSAFVLAGLAPPILVLFGIIDVLAATWTWYSLRADRAG